MPFLNTKGHKSFGHFDDKISILILKYLKATAKYKWYLSNLVAFLRINLFVKIDLQNWLNELFLNKEKPPNIEVQGVLF